MSAPQFAQLRAQGVRRVAQAFGVEVLERPAPGSLMRCPACGHEGPRGTGDRRGPIGLDRSGAGWRCHRCSASGDGATLAAWLAAGDAQPTAWGPVFEACADVGLCDPPEGAPARPRRPFTPPPPPAPPALPARPPGPEVARVWASCRPVLDDAAASTWLRSPEPPGRGLDPAVVELYDLARALPAGVELPGWARRGGQPWNAHPARYQLVAPLFDDKGALASLHARAIGPASGAEKAAQATGYEARGLVMADPLARMMLAGDADALELVRLQRDGDRAGLIIVEGLPDFLSWATEASDADAQAPAVLGVFAGSWTADLAERIPDGARVALDLHHDPAGDRYAARIISTLAERIAAGRLSAGRMPAWDLP